MGNEVLLFCLTGNQPPLFTIHFFMCGTITEASKVTKEMGQFAYICKNSNFTKSK